jgi:hypothetical protein
MLISSFGGVELLVVFTRRINDGFVTFYVTGWLGRGLLTFTELTEFFQIDGIFLGEGLVGESFAEGGIPGRVGVRAPFAGLGFLLGEVTQGFTLGCGLVAPLGLEMNRSFWQDLNRP